MMKFGATIALSITMCMLVACGSVEEPASTSPAPTPDLKLPADFSVTLQRTACRGKCPVYTVTVKADGHVLFDGTENVANPGIHKETIEKAAVAELVASVQAADFFNLDDCYCEEKFFDVPTSIVTVTMGGLSHSVTHLKGNQVPEEFLTLEQNIDDVGGSEQWVKGPA